MDIKDIKVGETYRFVNKAQGMLDLPQFEGGTAYVRRVDTSTDVFPVTVDLARGTARLSDMNVGANELEVI